jgi:hypothetical protein
VKSGRLKSVAFASGGHRVKLSAWSVIDASQGLALARLATQDDAGEQGDTSVVLLARIGGIDTRVQSVFDAEVLRQYAAQFRSEQVLEEIPPYLSYPELIPCLRGGTAMLSAAGMGVRVEGGAGGLTAAGSRCRDGIFAALGFLQRNVPGYENCHLIHFASRPLHMEAPHPVRLRAETTAAYDSDAIEDIPVLAYRDAVGVTSFNLALHRPPIFDRLPGDGWDELGPMVHLVDRGREGAHSSDIGAMELFAASVVSADPFGLAAQLRAALGVAAAPGPELRPG